MTCFADNRLRLVVHRQGAARNDLVGDFHGRRTANLLSARPHRCLAELRGLGRDAHALVFLMVLARDVVAAGSRAAHASQYLVNVPCAEVRALLYSDAFFRLGVR